jgi:hypothetical protein
MLARQLHLKLTKFTRRSRGTKGLVSKVAKGFDFVRYMSASNMDAIKRSRNCLEKLAAQQVQEVSLYGAGDIAQVLYDLTFEIPVKINSIYDDFNNKRIATFKVVPVAESAKSHEKVIIASFAAVDDKLERLRKLGIDNDRIVVLN